MVVVDATVVIDPEPGGKKLQAVWLERADGERWVVAYRPDPCWRAVEGHTMRAVGVIYEPVGQAIGATHFRVERFYSPDPTFEMDVVELGAEQTVTGTLAEREAPAGSKMAGTRWPVLEGDDGTTWMVSRPETFGAAPGQRIEATGRAFRLSPFVAHMSGPRLCVRDARVLP